MSGEHGRWIRMSQPSSNSFFLIVKETCNLELSRWKILHFLLTNSRHFAKCCFQLVSLGAVLVGSNLLVFQKELIIEDSLPIPPYIHLTFFEWRLAFSVAGGGSSHLPHDLSHSTLLCSIRFSLPITICFENRMFSLCFRESHAEIQSRFSLNLCENH